MNAAHFLKKAAFLLMASPLPAFCFFPTLMDKNGADEEMEFQDSSPQPAPQTSYDEIVRNSRLQIGGNYARVNLWPHEHRSFSGNLGGAQALYEYMPMNRFYGAAKFTWREGRTHGPAGERSLLYFDGQERLGYTFATQANDWRLTLFSGFGYHYLGNHFEPETGSSIRLNYNEFYFPVGLLTNYQPTWWLGIGADFTWMPQVYPTVSIVPLKGARWNLENTFANYYASLPLTFTLTKCKRFTLTINPFYEHWKDGNTTARLSTGDALGIPGNTYNFYGVDLNFGFCF